MKSYNFLLFLLLTVFSTLTYSDELAFDTTAFAAFSDHQTTERILLIGFPDQHMHRIQRASISSSYRRRGSYQSSTWSERITSNIENEYHLQKLTEWPMTEVGVHCAVYLVPADQSMEKIIAELVQDERVQIVQRMHQFKTRIHQYNDPYFILQKNLHEIQINLVHSIATGRNVTIAMIDTGVDTEHPDLAGQIEVAKNFAVGISSSFANDMHGTAIAGTIIAHKDNSTGIVGVAPNARLIALKACWPDKIDSFAATCNSFTLALAINAAIKLGVDILNMSLAGPPDPLLEILLKQAIKKGIIVIAACPSALEDNMHFPASLENVISVMSERSSRSDNTKQKYSFSAPGIDILTTLPHGTYDFVSGSSLSAAQVSGLVALLLELKPDLTLDEIYQILQNSTLVAANSTKKEEPGNRINASLAVLEICNDVVCLDHL
jgi:subtilase family protein